MGQVDNDQLAVLGRKAIHIRNNVLHPLPIHALPPYGLPHIRVMARSKPAPRHHRPQVQIPRPRHQLAIHRQRLTQTLLVGHERRLPSVHAHPRVVRAGDTHGAELPRAQRRQRALHPRDGDIARREPGGAVPGEDEAHAAVVREPDGQRRAARVVDGRDVGEERLQRQAARLQDEGVRRAGEGEGDVAGVVAGPEGCGVPFDVDGRGPAGGEDGREGPRLHVVGLVGHAGMPVVRRAVDQVDFAAETHCFFFGILMNLGDDWLGRLIF